MKKLLGILVISLVWCNVSFSEIIEFRKCYAAKYSTYIPSKNVTFGKKQKSWNDYSKKGNVQDIIYTINFDAGTITKTLILTDAGVKIPDEYIDDFDMRQLPRVKQTVFVVTTFTSDLITAKFTEEDADDFTESTLYFDIEATSADFEETRYSKNTGKKASITNAKIKCEETLDSIADGDKSGSSGTAFFINKKRKFTNKQSCC